MGQDELANAVVEGETVDGAALHGDDELGRGTVHGETGSQQLSTGLQDVLLGALGSGGELVDTENGTDRDTGVEVRRTVNGIASDGVVSVLGVAEEDDILLLFGNQQGALSRGAHGLNEEVIGDDIELLLFVTGGVGGTGQTSEVDQGSTADVVGDGLEGVLEGVAEETT